MNMDEHVNESFLEKIQLNEHEESIYVVGNNLKSIQKMQKSVQDITTSGLLSFKGFDVSKGYYWLTMTDESIQKETNPVIRARLRQIKKKFANRYITNTSEMQELFLAMLNIFAIAQQSRAQLPQAQNDKKPKKESRKNK